MNIDLPINAGIISTTIFALSTLPMLRKAVRTKDLGSYSLGNILLANTGNAIHSVYVFHMPPGPIWLLHSFYLVTTGLMLFWYLRYEGPPHRSKSDQSSRLSNAADRGMPAASPEQRGTTPATYHFRGMAVR